MNSSTWSFTGGTVGMLGEHKVMFGNIMIQDYTLADGTAREGLTAALSLPNRKKWDLVGIGSTFALDSITYEVINIEKEDSYGQVTVNLYVPTWSFTGGTVGMLGEHKVMFGNIMIQDYTLADGAAREGLTAALSLPNRKKWDLVGVGSTFSLDDITYEVINIEEGDYQGQVTVAKKNN